ncbi:MAG TPA: 16S rRNA (cytosine(1402)-N(4))-methyltransferase RsmH [Steroidobacteraceae bacterium]|nr:16S rRNA (cytosine(1402)-N(4))-methyltransferase RsmH [Steroidobacteraceae bacterium]
MDEHTPVLVEEAISALALRADGLYVDATFGRGGHTAGILRHLGEEGQVVAIDRDPRAIAAGKTRFAGETRLRLVHGEFAQVDQIVRAQTDRESCDGILFDLGVSSPQLDDPARGFSFSQDGPLDMRMDPTRGESVAMWLAHAGVDEIRHVIATLGEERFARRIASAIVRNRDTQPLERTAELAALVARCVPTREAGKNPATRTFQALRMHINDELGQIERGLEQAARLLAIGGRLVAISFHSLEDRLVKQFIASRTELDPALARLPVLPAGLVPPFKRIGRKQRASQAEVAANVRSRSAVLRVAQRQA